MKRRIMDLSTAENRSCYINGIDFQEEEMILSYSDGTTLSIIEPTEEKILFYRKVIEEQIKEVLLDKKLEKEGKILASSTSMLKSTLTTCAGLYLSGAFMKKSMLRLIVRVLCIGANMMYLYSQGKRMSKILFARESLRAYEFFFKYQEKFEKDFDIHIEDVYELDLSHMMSLMNMENDMPKEDRGSILKLIRPKIK